MKRTRAEFLGEYGPFAGMDRVHGVSFDGRRVWFATGEQLNAIDPESGEIVGALNIAASAGTAFDGKHLFQIDGAVIRKIDPTTGKVVATIPTPVDGDSSGLAWAEGTLWVGQYRGARIHQIDPDSGTVLRTIHSDRFVTGVTWVDGDLWHGSWQDQASEVRRIDPETGEVLEQIEMPTNIAVSGLESDGKDRFFCGGANSGKVRVIRRPSRG